MRNVIAIVFTFLLVLPATASAQSATYNGFEYDGLPPDGLLPNGVRHMGGGLLGDIEADPVYGISTVEKGKTKMLWFESSTGRDSTGITGWRVMDVLSFPGLVSADYLFFYGDPGVQCTRAGKDIQNLVGVGRIIRRQAIFRPSKLWVADIATKKFKPVALRGVRCVYSEP